MDFTGMVAMILFIMTGSVAAQTDSGVPAPPADSSAIIRSVPVQQAAPDFVVPDSTVESAGESVMSNPVPSPIVTRMSDCNSCHQPPFYAVPMNGCPASDGCGCTENLRNFTSGYNQSAMNLWNGYAGSAANRYSYGNYGGYGHRPAYRSAWPGRRCCRN